MADYLDLERLLEEIIGLPIVRVTKGPDNRGDYLAWCVFHDDGKGKPPHTPNLKIGPRGFYCHACGKNGGLIELAKELGIEVRSKDGKSGEEPEAVYSYRDAEGGLLFQVVRFPGKKFLCRRSVDGKWVWGLGDTKRPLYNLPHIIEDKSAPVYIVEGEKDADRLTLLGLLATSSPHGAGKWKDEHAGCLRDRDVIIIPDNDDGGKKHAEVVVKSLDGIAKSIKVVSLPDLQQEKGDVSDWLDMGHTPKDLQAVVEKTPVVGMMPKVTSTNADAKTREACIVTLMPDLAFLVGEENRLYIREALGWERLRFKQLYRKVANLVFSFSGDYPSNHKVNEIARSITMLVNSEVGYTDFPTVAFSDRVLTIDPSNGELVDAKPNGIFPHLYYRYIEEPKAVAWHKFLNSVIPDENLQAIVQEFLGMAFFPGYNPQKAMLLIGPGVNGKTTLLTILSHIFRHYTSSVNINSLEDGVMVDALDNSLINVSEETLTERVVSSAGFKAVTGDSLLMANPKYQPPYSIRPTAKWVISTNGFPLFDETTSALARRLLFMPMDVVIDKALRRSITEILTDLRPERDHIVSWMFQGAQRYFRQNGFTFSSKSEDCLGEWKRENSPILFWLHSVHLTGERKVMTLYDDFKYWARENGFRQLSVKSFSRRMISLGFTKRRRMDGMYVDLRQLCQPGFQGWLDNQTGDDGE